MTDFDALYAAVLARPHDDTPRLVLADWLDDQSDAFSNRLGRFVRTQYAIANFPYDDDAASLAPLIQQEGELWGSYPEADDVRSWNHRLRPPVWEAELPILPYSYRDSYGAQLLARHGFVDVVRGTRTLLLGVTCWICKGEWCPDCEGHGGVNPVLPALVSAFPIREVSLSDFEPLEWCDRQRRPYFTVEIEKPRYNREFCVPAHIWKRMAQPVGGGGFRRYDSGAEARADVSRAALDWAAAQGRS